MQSMCVSLIAWPLELVGRRLGYIYVYIFIKGLSLCTQVREYSSQGIGLCVKEVYCQ
jgi:hypothetical protein